MKILRVGRGARVECTDGEAGRVSHIVVDPATGEPLAMVLQGESMEWLLPLDQVISAESGVVRLRGNRASLRLLQQYDASLHQPYTAEEERSGARRDASARGADAAASFRVQRLARVPAARRAPEAAGTMTLAKRVTERVETVTVPVRRERVVIEHRSVTEARPASVEPFREGLFLEVPVMRERPIVGKEAVVANDADAKRDPRRPLPPAAATTADDTEAIETPEPTPVPSPPDA